MSEIIKDTKKGAKKILVTGGAGFVGSHLCEALVKDLENEVVSLDNYSSGKKENHIPGVRYIEGNTKDIFSIDFVPDLIFHLGEYSRVEASFKDIELVLDSNIRGTLAVLEFARKHKIRLIYAGSSTKFGDIGKDSSPYAYSKSNNTQLVKNYGEWFGLDYAICYFYNVYGGREIRTGNYATLIGIYTEILKNGGEFGVVSPGTQRRNFTHIDDTISALLLIGKYAKGDEFGIGADESFSILEIAKMFGDESKIKMLPPRKGNRQSAEVVSQKTKALGWAPKRSIKEYIQDLKQGALKSSKGKRC